MRRLSALSLFFPVLLCAVAGTSDKIQCAHTSSNKEVTKRSEATNLTIDRKKCDKIKSALNTVQRNAFGHIQQ